MGFWETLGTIGLAVVNPVGAAATYGAAKGAEAGAGAAVEYVDDKTGAKAAREAEAKAAQEAADAQAKLLKDAEDRQAAEDAAEKLVADQKAQKALSMQKRGGAGRRSTILTSPMGTPLGQIGGTDPGVGRKMILGG